MRNFITTLFVFGAMTTFAQVNPSSSTQGAVTGGAAAQTKAPLAKVVGVSMKDMNRLHGSYINGNVDAQGGDKIMIVLTDQVPSPLDFTGTVVFVTDLVLELDGYENITGTSMQIQISAAPANNSNPKELYLITRSGSTDEWMLKEDPFNPK
ncbi:MAG: hypothetical protein ISQ44_06365 [Cryomorphaceae bacterium]|nr:hypothetical protein [Cryomorphaceae bacterium]MBL6868082.1 hypothetical protein [Cryomorphaceae bacterium]